jgi:hypothetical protein
MLATRRARSSKEVLVVLLASLFVISLLSSSIALALVEGLQC